MANWLYSWFSNDIAIDLGTSNTLLYVHGRGIVINEPSVVAISNRRVDNFRMIAVGREAKDMLGRTPGSVQAIRPIQKGVIVDFDAACTMLRHFIYKANGRRSLIRPRVVIAVPVGITEVEKRAVKEAAESGYAGEVFLIEEPMAAAIGAGLPITEPSGNMIIDIGGGTTEVAVISLGGIVFSHSIRIGGDNIDDAICTHVKNHHSLLIGDRTAEQIKIRLGCAWHDEEERSLEIKGRDVVDGVPRVVRLSSQEICEAIQEPISNILEAVRVSLERTPPELASDIVDKGVVLTGGGALLKSFDKSMHKETQVPVVLADDPLCGTVLGAGKVLQELDKLHQVLTD